MELTHAGPQDADREAAPRAPSGIVCSDLVGPIKSHGGQLDEGYNRHIRPIAESTTTDIPATNILIQKPNGLVLRSYRPPRPMKTPLRRAAYVPQRLRIASGKTNKKRMRVYLDISLFGPTSN